MRSWVEISQSAFEHNVKVVRAVVGERIAIGIVLKANAYGHGLKELSLLAEQNKEITWLIVATLEEALQLRYWGCKKEILTLSYFEKGLIGDALHNNIVIGIIDRHIAQTIADVASRQNVLARVHIKMDMGMNRLGLKPHEVPSVLSMSSSLRIEGIFSHLGISSNPDSLAIINQISSFNRWCDQFSNNKVMRHIGASGLVWAPHLGDMVRIGTMAYGSWKSDIHRIRILRRSSDEVIPIMAWKARIVHIKHIAQGDYVGYDQIFCATKSMRIAILPVGYADGYPRDLSQKGVVFVEGRYASVLGLVSMNLMAIDISDIPIAREGSEVTFVGPQSRITPNELARSLVTNPNDITSGINPAVARLIVTGVLQ